MAPKKQNTQATDAGEPNPSPKQGTEPTSQRRAKTQKFSTDFPGVRYWEHKTRKWNGRPDRYFTIYYTVPGGKRREEGVGWASEGMSPKKANEIRGELTRNQREGRGPQTLTDKREVKRQEEAEQTADSLTFAELAAQFIEWAKNNKKTWKWDDDRLRVHVLPVVGKLRVKDITSTHVENVRLKVQEKGLAPATINHCLQLIRRVFNHGGRFDIYLGPNPTKKIQIKKPDNKRVRFLSYDEAEQLLDKIKVRSIDWHDICLMSLFAGLRFGEIAALTWHDVDLEHDILHILDAKAGDREAYITDRLHEMFVRRKAESDSIQVFPGRYGEKMEDVSNSFLRTVAELGWNDGIEDRRKKVTFHTLRHTFASWLAMQGTPILTIKELMGHKTLEMTMRYAHLVPDQKRAAVTRLGFGKKPTPAKVTSIR